LQSPDLLPFLDDPFLPFRKSCEDAVFRDILMSIPGLYVRCECSGVLSEFFFLPPSFFPSPNMIDVSDASIRASDKRLVCEPPHFWTRNKGFFFQSPISGFLEVGACAQALSFLCRLGLKSSSRVISVFFFFYRGRLRGNTQALGVLEGKKLPMRSARVGSVDRSPPTL